jgi:hypothetical protein
MPAERIDIQAVRAPQIVRQSRQDEFLDSARFSWADKAFYVTAGACFLDPSFTA